MADITKQSYEEFRIDVDFGLNMETGEKLNLSSCNVVCEDKDGNNVTSTLLDIATMTLVTGNESGSTDTGLQVLIRAGSESGSKYKYTFYGVTDASPPNKYEKDLFMKIKER